MVIVAAYCLYRVLSRRGISIMAGLMGLGILGVGIFPGNHPAPHQVSSLLAFTAGGIAVLLGWRVQAGPLRYLYLALGVVSLWVAYPVVLWLVSFGSTLCRTHEPRGRPEAGVTG